MRPIVIYSWLLLAFFPLFTLAQEVPFDATFYFETASTTFNLADQALLETVVAQSKSNPKQAIVIQGHTDDRGSQSNNRRLSSIRANSILEQLVQEGVAPEQIHLKAFGERYPLYSNQYESGRAFNRRVEVFFTDEVKEIHFTQLYKNNRLKEQLRPAPEQLVIKNPKKETFWTTEKGTKIYIPANAFKNVGQQPVILKFSEAYEFGDMLLYGLSTTSNQGLLTTGGMFELTATTTQGRSLVLRPSKQIGIQVPTEEVLPEMQLYDLDITSVTGNWTTPRALRATAAFMNGQQGPPLGLIMGHQVEDCPSLESMLAPQEEDRLEALEAVEAARQRWLKHEIRPKEEFPQDSVQELLATNKAAQTTISEDYVSPCKNIFCKIGEAFQKKRLQATAKETALEKQATLRKEQKDLEAELKRLKKEQLAHRTLREGEIAEKTRLEKAYKLAQQNLERFERTQIEIAAFQASGCYKGLASYPNMPDTLHPLANRDYRFAVHYYQRNLDSLQKNYPLYETIIAQALYGVDTYQEALKKQQFDRYVINRDLDKLQKYFPEREEEVCQRLYKVATYKEAKIEQRFQAYISKKDFDALKRVFPSREKEACQQLYQVDNFKAARALERSYRFVSYCQTYNIEKLKEEFPSREKEACQIMYGLNDYATAKKAVARAANLKETYYRLQLTNRSLGSWKNLDYLRKIPSQLLLAEEVQFQGVVSLFREDYLVYSDTRAMNVPYQRSTSFSRYRNVVKRLKHTLVSYYAVDDHTVALAKTVFVGGQEEAPLLVYKNISIDAFKEQLKAMN